MKNPPEAEVGVAETSYHVSALFMVVLLEKVVAYCVAWNGRDAGNMVKAIWPAQDHGETEPRAIVFGIFDTPNNILYIVIAGILCGNSTCRNKDCYCRGN